MHLDNYLRRMERIALPVVHGAIPSELLYNYNTRNVKSPTGECVSEFKPQMFIDAMRQATLDGRGKAENELRIIALYLALHVCSDKMDMGQWENILHRASLCVTIDEKYECIGAFIAQYGYIADAPVRTLMTTLGLEFRKGRNANTVNHAADKANKHIFKHPVVADVVEWYALYMKEVFKLKK